MRVGLASGSARSRRPGAWAARHSPPPSAIVELAATTRQRRLSRIVQRSTRAKSASCRLPRRQHGPNWRHSSWRSEPVGGGQHRPSARPTEHNRADTLRAFHRRPSSRSCSNPSRRPPKAEGEVQPGRTCRDPPSRSRLCPSDTSTEKRASRNLPFPHQLVNRGQDWCKLPLRKSCRVAQIRTRAVRHDRRDSPDALAGWACGSDRGGRRQLGSILRAVRPPWSVTFATRSRARRGPLLK
jgi:hypothetical protein